MAWPKTFTVDNRSFFVPNSTLSFNDSVQYCQDRWAKLAEIVKPRTWRRISKNLLQDDDHISGDIYRIGLKPCPGGESHQIAKLTSGSACERSNRYYRPNHYKKRPQCPSFILHKHRRGDAKVQLDTVPCSANARFVCELNPPPQSSAQQQQQSDMTLLMTPGAVAAIAVTSLLIVLLIVLLCVFCYRSRRRSGSRSDRGSFFSSTSGMKETASVRWRRRRQKVSRFSRPPVFEPDVQHFHGSLDGLGVGSWAQQQQPQSRRSRNVTSHVSDSAADPGYNSELAITPGNSSRCVDADVTAPPPTTGSNHHDNDNNRHHDYHQVHVEITPPTPKTPDKDDGDDSNATMVVLDAMDSGFSAGTADQATTSSSSSRNDDYVTYDADVFHEEADDRVYTKVNKSRKK